jgi:hypothetical protein
MGCGADESPAVPGPEAGAEDASADHLATPDAASEGYGGGQDASDAGSCLPPLIWQYTAPGCGADAHPACGPASQDACAFPVCSCYGQTILSCQFATQPFEHFGACGDDGGRQLSGPDGEAGTADVVPIRPDDSGACPADHDPLYASEGCGERADPLCVHLGVGYDPVAVCSCSGHTILSWSLFYGDSGSYASEPIAHVGACADAGTPEAGADAAAACAPPYVWQYRSPGCGAAAQPQCGPAGDAACSRPVCSCGGETLDRCSFALEPFAYVGACGDGGDAGQDL